jgi:LmbE family N-acetylglucosaminyl deacetylase
LPSCLTLLSIFFALNERGTSDAHVDPDLKKIRTKESENVANILKINTPIFGDFPDNGVVDHKEELTSYIKQQIEKFKPDLVITYDESGGYGHPDHIAVSQAVTSLLKSDYPSIHLWYTSTPEKLFKQLSLPTQMAKNQEYLKSRKSPSFKIWVGMSGVVSKIQAVYAYRSQFDSFVKGVPIKQIPMWFYVSLTPYEYFYEVN